MDTSPTACRRPSLHTSAVPSRPRRRSRGRSRAGWEARPRTGRTTSSTLATKSSGRTSSRPVRQTPCSSAPETTGCERRSTRSRRATRCVRATPKSATRRGGSGLCGTRRTRWRLCLSRGRSTGCPSPSSATSRPSGWRRRRSCRSWTARGSSSAPTTATRSTGGRTPSLRPTGCSRRRTICSCRSSPRSSPSTAPTPSDWRGRRSSAQSGRRRMTSRTCSTPTSSQDSAPPASTSSRGKQVRNTAADLETDLPESAVGLSGAECCVQ
mmetsp:Transcript_36069/g.72758  ORF Transcript_36069/g.72758 Transcript_36069/m.72758 type:complete len:268 (+) Transcript_36069:336-1139(+)